jgi:putative ABC transport system permease protein
MRLIVFLLLRGWRSNRLRTFLSILGIALGVGVVTAIHVTDHNTIQSQLRARAPGSGRVDFELTPKERGAPVEAARERLAARDDVAAVGVLHRTTVAAGRDGLPPVRVQLFGMAPLPDRAFALYLVEDGSDLSGLDGDGAVLVGAALAAELGLAVGDPLVLAAPPQASRTRCRDGERVEEAPAVATAPAPATVRIAGLLAAHGLGDREGGRILVGSYALARRFGPRDSSLLQLNRIAGSDPDRLRQALEGEFVVRDEREALLGESSDERAFRNGVKLLGGLALMLGMFVVFQTLSQALVERLRQIGILRCLGTPSGSIAAVFTLDALAMALAGVLGGLLLGLLIAWLLQQARISTLGMLKSWSFHEIPFRPLFWTAVLGVGFTLAGAGFPLWRARRVSALRILHARGLDARQDVLRGVNVFLFLLLVLVLPAGYLAMTTLLADSERETRVVLLQLGALLLAFGGLLLLAPALIRTAGRALLRPLARVWPLPVHLCDKALTRQTGRFAASVCGLGLVLVAWLGLESLTTALHGDARAFGRRALEDRLFVRGEGVTEAAARGLADLPGVRAVDPLLGPVFAPLQVVGLRPDALARRGGPLAGRAEDLARFAEVRSLVVSERLARLSGLAAGSAVTLVTDAGPVGYTILAVSDAVGFFPDDPAWAIAHPRWLEADFCVPEAGVEGIVLHLESGVDPRRVLAAARERMPQLRFAKTGRDIVDYLVRDVTRDFRLFQILLGLVLLLAAIGVLNAMTIAALGRVREIGVLRALGTSRAQLRITFALEGAVIGGLASGTALLLGVPLGRLLVDGMNRVAGLDAPFLVPWHAILAVPALGIGIGVLAAVLPGSRAAQIEPADAVRFE